MGINGEFTRQLGILNLLDQSITSIFANPNCRYVGAQWVGRATESSTECASLIVVDDGSTCFSSTSEGGLVSEWAVASGDEGDFASDILWEIALQKVSESLFLGAHSGR